MQPAVVGMFFGVLVGVRTLSITWMIPLLAGTSVAVMVAPLTEAVAPTLKERG